MKVYKNVNGRLAVNSYFIVNEESMDAFVIDSGEDGIATLEFAKNLGVTIKALLLTHTHYDHAASAKFLQDNGVKVYVSKIEEDGLKDGRINLANLFGEFPSLTADFTFDDGDEFTVCDIKVKALITPGHTKGSACFIVGDCLFTGDTLMCESVGRTDLFTGNTASLMSSLKRIKTLDFDYKIYPGHYEESTLNYEKIYNPYLG